MRRFILRCNVESAEREQTEEIAPDMRLPSDGARRAKFPEADDRQQIDPEEYGRGEQNAPILQCSSYRHRRNGGGLLPKQVTFSSIDGIEEKPHHTTHHCGNRT